MQPMSRRSLLRLAGLVPAVALGACQPTVTTPPPPESPFVPGPLAPGSIILGETSGATALVQPFSARDIPVKVSDYNIVCADGKPKARDLPKRVLASVYYPYHERDHRVTVDNPFHVQKGPWPVLLYAHALRYQQAACLTQYPIERDFDKVGAILRHVASYGCVAVAPDLSWLPGDGPGLATPEQAIELRAQVLTRYYDYLKKLNATVFAGQLDLSRIVMVGHSTGGGAATLAGCRIAASGGVQASAYGLLAPYFQNGSEVGAIPAGTRNVLVVHGTKDTVMGWSEGYAAATGPKTLVTIPGANHFGFTDLCEYDNSCEPAFGLNGTVSRAGQQQAAAAYLAALLRLYINGDQKARPYLSGERAVEGLDVYGVAGVEVQQSGVKLPPVVKG